ncbi:MAG: Frr, ribosome recycling factor [Parcubacteria group bacterium]|nr:Frr, ribosome recycling factor [Parcubacteria group bacterium]
MAYDFSKFKGQITETQEWLSRELSGVRTGRAAPALLDNVRVDSYGARTPLSQIASVTVEDARTIRISPWDKTLNKPIEKAIGDADLGISVVVDDSGIRVIFPELTADRRTLLTKLANEKVEQSKVTLRGHRAEAIKDIDAAEKDGGMGKDEVDRLKGEVQKMVEAATQALEASGKKKQEEIAR